MDREAMKRNQLEQMLIDENKEPIDLPLPLLESITNNFAEDKKIGSGGFAVVYKGLLQNGLVAVKMLSQVMNIDENNFYQEVNSLIRVKHKNIVRFLGYCADTQGKLEKYHGKTVMADIRQRLLCFEYLPNGGLDKHTNDASRGLEWRTCYQIIKGICEGLHYLHQQNIVHLDLKPANILLDHTMVPKISDFGLSKCFDENQTRAITSKVVGSLGYMAPECYSGVITFKSDIYSLGIIISEILTGQKGYLQIENVLESWSARFQTSPGGIMWLEHVRVCAEIGLRCMDSDPVKRPMTEQILKTLEELEFAYGPTETELSAIMHFQPLEVYPLEVCFTWKQYRRVKCLVTLTNRTNYEVGVWIEPAKYPQEPLLSKRKYLWEPQSGEEKEESSIFRKLGAHCSLSILLTIMDRVELPPAPEMFDVVMFTTKREQELKHLEHHFTYNMKSEDSLKIIKEVGTVLYQASLRAVTCDHLALARHQGQVMTFQFVRFLKRREVLLCYLLNQLATTNQDSVIRSMDVHPTEKWVLVGSALCHASIWNYETQERVMEFNLISDHGIYSLKFIAGRCWFAAGDGNGSIHVYSYTTKDKVMEFEAHLGKRVRYLAVHPTDPLLLTASDDDLMIKLWDWDQGWKCIQVFKARYVSRLMVGTDTFAACCIDGIKVWNFHSSNPIDTFKMLKDLSFGTDNHNRHFLLTLGHRSCEVMIWDSQAKAKKEVHKLVMNSSHSTFDKVAWHPRLPILAAVARKSIFLWDTRTYRLMKWFELIENNYKIQWIVFVGTEKLTRLVFGCSKWIMVLKVDLPALLLSCGSVAQEVYSQKV